jgi:signal transduction histidine kinase
MKERRISLNEKLIVYLVFFGLAGIVLIEVFAYHYSAKALLNRTFDQLTSVRRVKTLLVETYLQERILNAQILADALSHGLHIEEDLFLGKIVNSGHYGWLAVRKDAEEDFFVYGLNKKYQFENAEIDKRNYQHWMDSLAHIVSYSSTARFFDSKLSGVGPETGFVVGTKSNNDSPIIVLLGIDPHFINEIMLEISPDDGLGLSGESYLVGPNNTMLTASRLLSVSPGQTINVQTFATGEALHGTQGSGEIYDYRNIKVLSSWGIIDQPDLGWMVIVEMDYSEAISPIHKLQNRLLLLGFIVTLFIFVFAFYFSRRLTKPLIQMNKAAGLIKDGFFDVSLSIKSNDEIGELASSFNEMARQLQEQKLMIQQERKSQIRSMFDGQELERQRLSKELHDGLGQALVGIGMQLEGITGRDLKDAMSQIERTKEFIGQTIEEIRRMSGNLAPNGLLEFGLIPSIRTLCNNVQEQTGKIVLFDAQGEYKDQVKQKLIYTYRIVQEAINNAVKHAESKTIVVSVKSQDNQCNISIVDDGLGFDMHRSNQFHGNGLTNMLERAQLMNASLIVESTKSLGTKVLLTIKW